MSKKEVLVGVLYKAEQKAFGKKFDPLFDFRKLIRKDSKIWQRWLFNFIEKKDSDMFSAAIGVLDNKFGEKIPVELKPLAREVAIGFLNDDYTTVAASGTALLNRIIDIPGVTEDTEALMLHGILGGMIEAMKAAIKK